MFRFAGVVFLCGAAIFSAPGRAQTPATPPADQIALAAAQTQPGPVAKPAENTAPTDKPAAPSNPPTADDICRAVEQDAAQNELPVEFFARVIWQESRFNALAVSAKGAQGIAQFMPQTADFRGLADPFDPIEALKNSASYLHDLRQKFGNLGLAAAGYNAGPGRVAAWLAGRRALPSETRNYVAIITGWTADEWASASPPQTSETTIPQGVPCTRLANLILAQPQEQQRIAGYIPRWGAQFTANWSESRAWATFRAIQTKYASIIGDRQPIVLQASLPGLGHAPRYIIRIADDNRSYLQKLCDKVVAAGGACVVLRNNRA
jgi:hypothetical protein